MRSPYNRTKTGLPLVLAVLSACGGGSGGGSSSGGSSSSLPSFTSGDDLIVDEDATVNQAAWATEIQNGALFTLSAADPALFHTPPAINGFGGLTFIPAEDKSGSTEVSVILQSAEGLTTSPATFRITVLPVNDQPSFDAGGDVTVEAASGSHTIEGWANNIIAGPADEAAQGLSFVVESNSAPELFQNPALLLSLNGNLNFNLAPGAAGEATITISLADDGGTSGLGANDTSAPASFTITASDTTAPSAEILYPPTGSLTDATTISVFGAADDSVGVDFLRVNGLPASTLDGYESWARQSVPLGPSSSLTAQAGDTSGNFSNSADTVAVSGGQALPIFPTALAFDSTQERLIFYSEGYEALFSYFPSTEQVLLFSEPAGEESWQITDLLYSASPPSLYAIEGGSKSVLSFNLTTGEASLVSGVGRGAGLSFDQPTGLTFVNAGPGSPPSLAVSDQKFGPEDSPAIVAVAINSGDRSVISSSSEDDLVVARGDGPDLNSPGGLHYQKSLSRFLVVDSEQKALLSVDENTGDRSVLISNINSDDGVAMVSPSDVALSSNGATAWILDPLGKKIFSAHLPSSSLSLLCSNSSPPGAGEHRWSSPRHFGFRSGLGLFVSDYSGHAIFSVSTSSGSRTAPLDLGAGDGPDWKSPTELFIDEPTETGFISCRGNDAIYSASLLDGERALLSGDGAGSGLPMFDPISVAVLSPAALIAVDVGAGQPRVLKISRPGGARTLISGQGVGGGVSFNSASSVAVNSSANAAYVLDPLDKTVTSVNLDTGDRYRVAGGGVGAGPALNEVASIAWHDGTSRLLLLQAGQVLSIDPASLQRELLCDLSLAGLDVNEDGRIACPLGLDHALISLSSQTSVVKISTATGSAVELFNGTTATGPPISELAGLGYSSTRRTLYLLSESMNALHAANTAANEQVIFSRR